MRLTCPACGRRVSIWEVPRFFRLKSVICPGCKKQISMDQTGRRALVLPVIGSLFLFGGLLRFGGGGILLLVMLAAGFIMGAFLAGRFGTLYLSEEDEVSRKK